MLPKQYRLTKERDMKRVITKGRSFFVTEFGIKSLKKKNELPTRIGIVVPKKQTRTIVLRNRIKRQVRHIFLEIIGNLKPGYDIVFLSRPAFIKLEFKEMRTKIINVLTKIKLINNL